MEKFFVSFIEEAVQNPNYYGYTGGRIEISGHYDEYPRGEIRFLTNKREAFYSFREKYDFGDYTALEVQRIKEVVQRRFNDSPNWFMRKVSRFASWVDGKRMASYKYSFYKLLQRR